MLQPYQQKLDQAGKACWDKHSSLLRKFINYGQKVFITLVLEGKYFEHICFTAKIKPTHLSEIILANFLLESNF
jgi:hypothetical protein